MHVPNRSITALSRLLPALGLLLAIACAAGASYQEAAMSPQGPTAVGGSVPAGGRAMLIFGNDTVNAEVASTPDQRSQGLMNRPTVPAGTGMLFVFQDEAVRSFWMRNTLVPLDVAFMDSEFRIFDIQQMEAGSEEFHDSPRPAMYALEVPEGWFAGHGVRIGDRPRVVFGGG